MFPLRYFKLEYKRTPQSGTRPKWCVFQDGWKDFTELGELYGVPPSTIAQRFFDHVIKKTGRIKSVGDLCVKKMKREKTKFDPTKRRRSTLQNECVVNQVAHAKMKKLLLDPKTTPAEMKKYQKLAYGVK